MTLAAPSYPLALEEALQHLTDALGANYGGPTDEATLTRALGVDGIHDGPPDVEGARFHLRPWATAARLIRDNTEYEVSKGLDPRIDRKLRGLEAHQERADALAGITALLPGAQTDWPPTGGPVRAEGVF